MNSVADLARSSVSWRWWSVAAAGTAVVATGITARAALDEPAFISNALVDTVIVAVVVTVLVVGLWLWRRWPANPSGPLVALAGLALGLLNLAFWVDSGWVRGIPMLVASACFTTLLARGIVAWPTGRPGRSSRRLLVLLAVAFVPAGLTALVGDDSSNWSIAELGVLEELAGVLFVLLATVAGLGLLANLVRRTQPLTGAARRLARPAVAAGVAVWLVGAALAVTSELAGDLQVDGDSLTPFGIVMTITDWGRLAVAVLILAGAAARSEAGRQRAPGAVELGPAVAGLKVQTTLAAAIGDPSLTVAYRTQAGTWVDGDGVATSDPGGPTASGTAPTGRAVTLIEQDGEAVAALEYDAGLAVSPALLGSVAAAAGLAVQHERLEALAEARLADVRAAGLAVIDAEDEARRRLERDLHDGAQQRLVGLALQAGLAATHPTPEATAEVHDGIQDAVDELDQLTAGILPAVLAERGLGAALGTVAATSPLSVDLHVQVPAGLAPGAAVVAWFVVCEAIANAVKHSGGAHLRVLVAVDGDELVAEVSDDGVGGADGRGGGLFGLTERVHQAGGSLHITSPPSRGTTVRATVPLAAAVAA